MKNRISINLIVLLLLSNAIYASSVCKPIFNDYESRVDKRDFNEGGSNLYGLTYFNRKNKNSSLFNAKQNNSKWAIESIEIGVIFSIHEGALAISENAVLDKLRNTSFYGYYSNRILVEPEVFKPVFYSNIFRPFSLGVSFKKSEENSKFDHHITLYLTQQSGMQSFIHQEVTSIANTQLYDSVSQPMKLIDSILVEGFDASVIISENRLGFNYTFSIKPLDSSKKLNFYCGVGAVVGSLRPSVSTVYYYREGYGIRYENDTNYLENNTPILKNAFLDSDVQENTKLKAGTAASFAVPLGLSYHLIQNFFNAEYLDLVLEATPTYTYHYVPNLIKASYAGIWFSARLKYVF